MIAGWVNDEVLKAQLVGAAKHIARTHRAIKIGVRPPESPLKATSPASPILSACLMATRMSPFYEKPASKFLRRTLNDFDDAAMEVAMWNDILERLNRAKNAFLERDLYLLEVNANERSMTHKFAEYLQAEFPDFSVDCEFNRKGTLPKELYVTIESVVSEDDLDARTVFPDIIVHHRGQRANLLVIEAKKSGVDDTRDRQKLDAFKTDEGYQYEYAVLMRFTTGQRPDIHFERY
jgi:hypothetical protein